MTRPGPAADQLDHGRVERYAKILPFVLDYKASHSVGYGRYRHSAEAEAPRRRAKTDSRPDRSRRAPRGHLHRPTHLPIGTGSDAVAISIIEIRTGIGRAYHRGTEQHLHGMPVRKILNQAMTVLSMGKGLDAGIVDERPLPDGWSLRPRPCWAAMIIA